MNNEPFSSSGLVGLKEMDDFDQLPGAPGIEASLRRMRQVFRWALARPPEDRSWAWARPCERPGTGGPLEGLHIAAPGRGGQSVGSQRPGQPVDVIHGDLPRRVAQQREYPFQHLGIVLDRNREPAGHPRGQARL